MSRFKTFLTTKWSSIKKYMKNLYKIIIENSYNSLTIVFFLISLGISCFFLRMGKSDVNFTYYLISVTAIYSTIQLSLLLQKISILRTQKETLLVSSIPLWNALNNYRYLCFIVNMHLIQCYNNKYTTALKLKISIYDLFLLEMGTVEKIDKKHLDQFEDAKISTDWLQFVLLVKILDQVVDNVGNIFELNSLNRIYAHNNNSVNTLLRTLVNEGVFNLYERVSCKELNSKNSQKTLYEQLNNNPKYLSLRNLLGFEQNIKITSVLSHLDSYVVNQILLPLYDNTFVIEKKLPNSFLLLLLNAVCILIFGSIIPLMNAFTLQWDEITRICGGLSVGMLLLSITLLSLTFYRENDADLFKYSNIVYQGKNNKL